MSHVVLLTLILVGPLPDDPASENSPPVAAAPSAADLRDQFRDLTLRTARLNDMDPAEVVPDLVDLYQALHEPNDVSGRELVDMRQRTRARLEKVRERLLRDRLKLQESQARGARKQARQPAAAGGGSVGVGMPGLAAELANAQQLIDVITQTIEPQTWQENGGRGSIHYFAPLHVLVVRNTARVHEQIGGALGNR
jgi:hypothetical protein